MCNEAQILKFVLCFAFAYTVIYFVICIYSCNLFMSFFLRISFCVTYGGPRWSDAPSQFSLSKFPNQVSPSPLLELGK